jgi:hypothetical protein
VLRVETDALLTRSRDLLGLGRDFRHGRARSGSLQELLGTDRCQRCRRCT